MEKKKLVVLTGAGISAESGLKTFRDSEDGLWNGYDVSVVASPQGWMADRGMVLDFYNMRRREVRNAQPNRAHQLLAEMEKDFDVHIITQNIDDLHERGGSTKVMHLHGEILKMKSERNPRLILPIEDDIKLGDLGEDGFQLRPHVVWFGEEVPMMEPAARLASTCEAFAVVGTSLQVYPAASLLYYVPPSSPVFIIDRVIPQTSRAQAVAIEEPATTGVAKLWELLLNDQDK